MISYHSILLCWRLGLSILQASTYDRLGSDWNSLAARGFRACEPIRQSKALDGIGFFVD